MNEHSKKYFSFQSENFFEKPSKIAFKWPLIKCYMHSNSTHIFVYIYTHYDLEISNETYNQVAWYSFTKKREKQMGALALDEDDDDDAKV